MRSTPTGLRDHCKGQARGHIDVTRCCGFPDHRGQAVNSRRYWSVTHTVANRSINGCHAAVTAAAMKLPECDSENIFLEDSKHTGVKAASDSSVCLHMNMTAAVKQSKLCEYKFLAGGKSQRPSDYQHSCGHPE